MGKERASPWERVKNTPHLWRRPVRNLAAREGRQGEQDKRPRLRLNEGNVAT